MPKPGVNVCQPSPWNPSCTAALNKPRENKVNVEGMLAEAVRQYLWELDRGKISEESKTYRQRHAELKAQYLGQYIAMRDGQVVDHDADFQTLRQRIRQRFEDAPVMITLVKDEAEQPLVRHGFRVETPGP